MDASISVVIPVFNHDDIIEIVIRSVIAHSTMSVREIIVINDASTDRTEEKVRQVFKSLPARISGKIITNSSEQWEVKCCNIGFKRSTCPYIMNIQDDMVMTTYGFDDLLMKPFRYVDRRIFAVTARDACDVVDGGGGYVKFINFSKQGSGLFSVRDIINRGPILFKTSILAELDYLDEDFAPINQDDTDICLRAYRKGYIVGSYRIPYVSEDQWGTSRKPENITGRTILIESARKNMRLLLERHRDLIEGPKHDEDILV